jgi:ADP-ribose pyrophosphatase YjhB (NUDIX family)
MTTPHRGRRLRALAFRIFYGLPGRWRRRLVRLLVPKFVVGAVVLVRDADAPAPGRLLLVRQPPGTGWSLPAGLLHRGERPIEAAARELAEETGVTLGVDDLAPASPSAIVHAPAGQWVDTVFDARVSSAKLTLQPDGAEVLEVAWYPLDALPPLTHPTATLLAHYNIGPLADYPEVRQ